VPERLVERERLCDPVAPAHLKASGAEEREELREDGAGAAIDECEVEPIADAEPVEARLGERERLGPFGRGMDVEDAAPLGMGERPDAVLRGEPGELRRRLAASAQDDERDPPWQRDEDTRPFPVGRTHEPDRPRREGGLLERRSEDAVHELGHGVQRGAACAEDAGVQALEQLSGDVEGDIRASLEVRADDADGDPPLLDEEAVREAALADLALERRQRCEVLYLGGEGLDAAGVQAQPVERPGVEATLGGFDVGVIRSEDLRPAGPDEPGRRSQGVRDGRVREGSERAAGFRRLLLDESTELHDLRIEAGM
jgi:hypothetical protein